MRSRPRSSIRTLLRVWIIGLALSALALSLLFLGKNANDHISQQMQLARDLTQLYSDDSISIEYGRNNFVYVADSLRRLKALLKGDVARIVSNQGIVAESSVPSEVGRKPAPPTSAQRIVAVDVREHSSSEKLGTLEVLVNRDALFASAIKKAAIPTFALLLVLSVLSLLIIRSLQRRIIRPIEQILAPTPAPGMEIADWPLEFHDLQSRLQEALVRRDLAVIGQIAGGVIHDLKTLLHSVWTAAHLADEQAEGTERRLKRLESLLKAANTNFPKMNALIQTTLDGAAEIRIQASPNSIVNTIEQALKATKHLAARSRVTIRLEAKDRSLVADHDPVQLERAITNIVKNAVEAAAPAGPAQASILIRAESGSEQCLHIAVEDSGPGLGRDPAQIFHSIQSTKAHGSGLGLMISRKIVEAHRGQIIAGGSSTLGGAKFDIILPFKEQQI